MAKNALVHGLCSLMPVIPHEESETEWLTHRKAMVDRLSPEGALEQSLAERIALNLWRLARCARTEVRAIEALREKARWRSISAALENAETAGEGVEEAYHRLEETGERFARISELWGDFVDESKGEFPITPEEADLLFDDAIPTVAFRLWADEFNEEFEWPPASFDELRVMLDWCGQRVYMSPDLWMVAKQREAEERARKLTGRLSWIRKCAEWEAELAFLDPQVMVTLQRHETGIHRSLHRDLHELQRIQAMRLGVKEVIPLAIDLSVE